MSRLDAMENLQRELAELNRIASCVRTWSHAESHSRNVFAHEERAASSSAAISQAPSRKRPISFLDHHGSSIVDGPAHSSRHDSARSEIRTASSQASHTENEEGKLQRFFKAAISAFRWKRAFGSAKFSGEASFTTTSFSSRLSSRFPSRRTLPACSSTTASEARINTPREIFRMNSCPERTGSQRSMMSGRFGQGAVVTDGTEAFRLLMALEVSAVFDHLLC